MAKEASSPTLRFGLSDNTLNRVKKANEAGRLKEGDKTIFDTAISGLETIETGIETREKAKDLALDELNQVLAQNLDGTSDWTKRGTLESVIQIQQDGKDAYLKAVQDGDTQEQARLLDLNKAQSASLVDWKESYDIMAQMFGGELFSEGYLKNHPEASDLMKQMVSQQDGKGNALEPKFNDQGEMYFTMTVNGEQRDVYTRDIDEIVAQAGATTSVTAVAGPFPKNWNYNVALANNIKAYEKEDILLQTFTDKGQFGGTSTLRNDLVQAFTGATVNSDGEVVFVESNDPNVTSAGNVGADIDFGKTDNKTLDKDDDGDFDSKDLVGLQAEDLEKVFDVLLTERDGTGKLVHKKTLAALAGSYLTDLQVQNGAGKASPLKVVYETSEEKKNRKNPPKRGPYTATQIVDSTDDLTSTGSEAGDMDLLRQHYGDGIVDGMIKSGQLKAI